MYDLRVFIVSNYIKLFFSLQNVVTQFYICYVWFPYDPGGFTVKRLFATPEKGQAIPVTCTTKQDL